MRHSLSLAGSLLVTAAGLSLPAPLLAAPVELLNSYQVYTQRFDELPFLTNNAGANVRWNNDQTVAGWYIHRAATSGFGSAGVWEGTNAIWYVSDGSLAANAAGMGYGAYSLGGPSDANRSLGFIPSSESGEISAIVVFHNPRPYPMKLTRMGYTGKAYRKNSNATLERISVSYHVYDSVAAMQSQIQVQDGVSGRTVAGWGSIPNLTAVFPMNEVDAADVPLFKLAPPTTVALQNVEPRNTSGSLLAIQVPPGKFLALRWGNVNDLGADGLIGIDELDVEFDEQVCELSATQSAAASRTDGASATDPRDDSVAVPVVISATGNAVANTYDIISPAELARTGIRYGSRDLEFTGATIDAARGQLTLVIQDSTNTSCRTTLVVDAPACQHFIDVGEAVVTGNTYSLPITITGEYVADDFSISTSPQTRGKLGVPTMITNLPIGSSLTVRLRDVINPTTEQASNCSQLITLDPPRRLGDNNLTGKPIYTSSHPEDSNSPWQVNPTGATATLNNAGVETGSSVKTSRITLPATQELYRVTGEIVAQESSNNSNFETDDQLKAELLIDEGLTTETRISLSDRFDRQAFFNPAGDGWINGFTSGSGLLYNNYRLFDEFNLAATGNTTGAADVDVLQATFPLNRDLPRGTKTVQLIITGDNDAADESFTLQNLRLVQVLPELLVSTPTQIQRLETTPGDLTQDEVSFQVTISNPVGGLGWQANTRGTTEGTFGTYTLRIPVTQSSVTFTDKSISSLQTTVTVPIPARYTLGTNTFTGNPISTKLDVFPDAEWVNDAAAKTLRLSNSVTLKSVQSEVISLANIVGDVEMVLTLTAQDTSIFTNFEANDQFRAELILDGDTANPVSLIKQDWDRNGFTGAKVGWLNGFDGSAEIPYNTQPGWDEFNRKIGPGFFLNNETFTATFAMLQPIADSVQSVQVRIYGVNNNASESFTVSGLALRSSTADTDNDGMSDVYEQAYGLNPTDPDDVGSDDDGDGIIALEEYRGGTAANVAGKRGIRITSVAKAGDTLAVEFPALTGIRYRLQSSLDGLSWQDVGELISGIGSAEAPLEAGVARKFYRIRVVP
jgi:hypothetical protein